MRTDPEEAVSPHLVPAQQHALDGLTRGIAAHNVALLRGRPGAGKTSAAEDTVFAQHVVHGSAFLVAPELDAP